MAALSPMTMAIFMTTMISSPFLVMAIHVVRPGGKRGKLGAQRAHLYEGIDPAKLKGLIQGRLEADRFRILPSQNAGVLEAERRAQRPPKSMMDAYPYPRLPLKIRVDLTPRPEGTMASFSVHSLSYIYRESGELEYMEAFLDFLMGKQVLRSIPPDLVMNVQTGPVTAGLGVIVPWLIFLPLLDKAVAEQMPIVGALLGISGSITAIIGMVQISMNPTRYRGLWLGGVAIVLGLVAIGSGILAYVLGA